jgi:hypothetical protein
MAQINSVAHVPKLDPRDITVFDEEWFERRNTQAKEWISETEVLKSHMIKDGFLQIILS